ncbi:hypothetical protein MTO96_015910 [Rhipicephalus appendiculatus]
MDTDISAGFTIHRLFDGSAYTFSEESQSYKDASSVSLGPSQEEAEDDVSYASSELSIEDIVPDNRDVVAKPRNKADQLLQWDHLVDSGIKDETMCHCSTIHHASNTQRALCRTTVLMSAGWQHTVSTMESSTRGQKPCGSTILGVLEYGVFHSAAYSLSVLDYLPYFDLHYALRCVFAKADSNSDGGAVENSRSCLWKLCEV